MNLLEGDFLEPLIFMRLLLCLPLEPLEALKPLSDQPTLSLFGLVSSLRDPPYLERDLLELDDLDEWCLLRLFPLFPL